MKTHVRSAVTLLCLATGVFEPPAEAQRPPSVPAAPRIPLCASLRIVTAIKGAQGDYESIKTVDEVTPAAVRMTYSAEGVPAQGKSETRSVKTTRTIRREDLASATRYARDFGETMPEMLPGTTALGTSSAVLSALKTSGQAMLEIPNQGLLAGLVLGGRRLDPREIEFEPGTVRRVASGRAVTSVLVNDVRVELPVVHARGEFFGEDSEFVFLDQADNPIALRYAIARGDGPDLLGTLASLLGGTGRDVEEDTRDMLQVVKLSYRCSEARALERALAETGRADVYSLYFSFNSDRLREESEPTLAEIAAVMTSHPDWKLGIEGHTDNVASDSFNLDLSRRRAAAVKNALIARFGLNASRFATAGFGESRPKDSNDTLEGRARNRRVELVRQP
jgi:outer membrane protein OmpA-like peptidoglycan-associated protein